MLRSTNQNLLQCFLEKYSAILVRFFLHARGMQACRPKALAVLRGEISG
jgi:hypothetical protein